MLKKGDSVVFHREQRTAAGYERFTGYGRVESLHGEWVAIRYRFGDHECFCAAQKDDVFPEQPEASEEPHVVQQVRLFVDAFMRQLDDDGSDSDAVADRLRTSLLKMHAIGFMEGQGVTLSEPWEWTREAHRLASAFTRYHDFCATQDNQVDFLPDAARLCEFLVWAKGAIRGGGAVAPDQAALVYCATSNEAGKEGGEA